MSPTAVPVKRAWYLSYYANVNSVLTDVSPAHEVAGVLLLLETLSDADDGPHATAKPAASLNAPPVIAAAPSKPTAAKPSPSL